MGVFLQKEIASVLKNEWLAQIVFMERQRLCYLCRDAAAKKNR